MLVVSKTVELLFMPLGLVFVAGLVSLVLLIRGWRRAAATVLAVQLVVLYLAATPLVSGALVASLERVYPPLAPAAAPQAEAIVVLGGIVGAAQPPRLDVELAGSVDRLRHAAKLYRAGKGRVLVLSGGVLPWLGSEVPEAKLMGDILAEWGVPRDVMLTETGSRTTHENARNTAQMLRERGMEDVLLVTSALHMPRAAALFRSRGLRVTPAPTDIQVVEGNDTTPMDLLPGAEALLGTTQALHEYLGMVYYRMRGWIH